MKFWLRLAVLSSCVAGCWAQAPAASASEPVVNSKLDGPLFYQLLLGELNVRQGSPGAGFSLLLDAARKSRDPLLFQRAIDVALQSRSGEAALQAAQTWKRELPAAQEPHRYILQILLALNRVEEAGQALADTLQGLPENEQNEAIVSIPSVFARVQDKALAAQVVEKALASSLRQPRLQASAWTTIGRMRRDAQQTELAVAAAQRAHTADRQAIDPLVLALSLLPSHHPVIGALLDEAMQGDVPPDVRLAYIRHLITTQAAAKAQTQLQTLTQRHPQVPQGWLMQGLLQQDLEEFGASALSLKRYVDMVRDKTDEESQTGLTEALLALAGLAERQGMAHQTDVWLQQLPPAADPVRVGAQRAEMLAKRGHVEAARQVLESVQTRTPEQAQSKLLVLSRWLREHQQAQQAHDLIERALSASAHNHELMLEQSMNLEKLGRFDEMEKVLRQVIELRPQDSLAYNALGYSLADRNLRLADARTLLLKAVALSPNDPFIQDSLGWVEFRLGHLDAAVRILRSAFTARPDAEIAAHLGEVLWASGQKDEARAVWRQGLRIKADNETLVQTLQRLGVQP